MSKIVRRTCAMLFAACLTLAACQTGNQAQGQPTTNQAQDIFSRPGGVNVGVITDEPGFNQLKPGSNTRGGFDVDLYRWLGARVPPTFTPIPVDLTLDDRESALQEGRVQLVVETFAITDDRRKSVGFAGPYMLTQQGIMVRAGDSSIHKFNDLVGKSVCVLSGSTSLIQLLNSSLRNRITITVEKGYSGCIDRLLNGQVDTVSTDEIILTGFALNDPTHLSVVNELTFGAQERFGVGLPHGDIAACKAVTAKLKDLIVSGSWDQFFSVHFPGLNPDQYKPDPFNLDPCD
jgi:glutamate transport system substrate-binding protein